MKPSTKHAALAVAGAAAFLSIVFFEIPLLFKAPLAIASLAACGTGIAGYTRQPGYYGLVVLRGRKGFNLMRYLASHHQRFFSEMADFGLTLFFGFLYGLALYHKKPRKLAAHALLLGFFAFSFQFYVPGMQDLQLVLSIAGFLFGLAATFLAAIAFQAIHIAFNFQSAAPGAMPAIPGLTIPLEAIISIIVLMIVHETSHGVLFFIEKLRVKSSGVLLFGFIPVGAFVEQEEKQFERAPITKKRRVLVAGSTANFFAALAFVLLSVPVSTAFASASNGAAIESVLNTSSLYGKALPGEVITAVNGQPIKTTADLAAALQEHAPGETITLQTTAGEKTAVLSSDSKLGITAHNAPAPGMEALHSLLALALSVMNWTAVLNLMVALFNVMPLFITDGHLIMREELIYRLGTKRETTAKLVAKAVGAAFLFLLLINFLPWLK
ncbi:MAG: site-2 protease family protein [Candidatus Micrarchaeia archaeon]